MLLGLVHLFTREHVVWLIGPGLSLLLHFVETLLFHRFQLLMGLGVGRIVIAAFVGLVVAMAVAVVMLLALVLFLGIATTSGHHQRLRSFRLDKVVQKDFV
jgi:ABC-type multidrug transport system permease subunit